MTESPQYLAVGRIVRAHGVRGDVAVRALIATSDRLKFLETVFVGHNPEQVETLRQFQVTRSRHDKGDMWLMHLEGLHDRNQADLLRGSIVLVSLADAVPLEADEIYQFQVMGLDVHTTDGLILGKVTGILETGANDVYVVSGGQYGEVLLPAIDSVIVRISPETGTMLVRLMPGLLPETAETVDSPDSPDSDGAHD